MPPAATASASRATSSGGRPSCGRKTSWTRTRCWQLRRRSARRFPRSQPRPTPRLVPMPICSSSARATSTRPTSSQESWRCQKKGCQRSWRLSARSSAGRGAARARPQVTRAGGGWRRRSSCGRATPGRPCALGWAWSWCGARAASAGSSSRTRRSTRSRSRSCSCACRVPTPTRCTGCCAPTRTSSTACCCSPTTALAPGSTSSPPRWSSEHSCAPFPARSCVLTGPTRP